MKWLVAVLLLALAGFAKADPAEEKIKETIKDFLGDPASERGIAEGREILEYGEKTPDHIVNVDEKYLPWMGDKDAPPEGALLLASFVAGDLMAQMKKGSSKPEPYDGILTMIDTYNKLRTRNPDLRIAGMKELIDMEQMGQLKAHVEEIEAARPSPTPAATDAAPAASGTTSAVK